MENNSEILCKNSVSEIHATEMSIDRIKCNLEEKIL